MKFKEYLKDNILNFMLLTFTVISIEILLMIYNISVLIRIYIAVSILLIYLLGLSISYYKKKKFYEKVLKILEDIDKKYLLPEMIDAPDFLEGKILKRVIEDMGKAMTEHVNEYKFLTEDYKEYIELWIHEVKIPIATSKMIIENNKNEVTKNIDEELDKIDDYTEQALFYARSNTVNKDYIIKKIKLEKIVNMALLKNKKEFIGRKINVNIYDLDLEVATDSKWLVFILNQIISNSIKYKKQNENLTLEIFAKKQKENVTLYIKDNGIGISKNDISRIFEKGFTGENGRIIGKKSTGIGLYLCKKLCDKLRIRN